ncbi:MAG TPA: hypothetical protein VNH15_07180 [Elusimicrobiota bacterium]|nr:hypothetical protein [Elusimicrobiota bacterium]
MCAFSPAAARAQDLPPSHILNLNCLEALAAVGEPELSGIFSYVPDADTAAAFADLVVHQPAALRKFMAKDEADVKSVGGISQWDHSVAAYALSIYALPAAAATVDKPSSSDLKRLNALAAAPALSLEQMTARRNVKR